MTNPTEPPQDESTVRFRTITNWKEEDDPPQNPPPRPARTRPPRQTQPASPPPAPPSQPPPVDPPPETGSGRTSHEWRFGPAFWTVTGVLSLIVNAVLVALVLILLTQVSKMRSLLALAVDSKDLPLETVRGLYENFEDMEDAHIVTRIPVSTMVPVKLDVCIRTGTNVVTNQEVTIPDARVTVQTGGLNITNATTRIVLPANVTLPVNLDLCVPVETTIPVSLNVDVDIPLAQTDLIGPFTGLRQVVAPLYCMLKPDALTKYGTLVCDDVPPK